MSSYVPILIGPPSTFYVCGAPAVLVPLTVGGFLAVHVTHTADAGNPGTADYASAGAASALVFAYFCVLLYMVCWIDLEAYFSTLPWLSKSNNAVTSKGGVRVYQTRCPFTGLRPGFRCPSCQCRVHEQAFHQRDRFVGWPFGESVLRWSKAKAATESGAPLEQARAELDEALDLRGNSFSLAVTACCVGCATWQKCFQLAPLLALPLALTSMFFAFVPWGYASLLALINESGVVIKVITGSSAVGFAAAALVVQLRALGRANAFLCKYSAALPALKPLWQTRDGPMQRLLCATPWDPLL